MPAASIDILTITAVAQGAVSAHRFLGPDGPAANSALAGVTVHAVAEAGDLFPLQVLGVAVVEAGAAISANDEVASDADGRAVAHDGESYVAPIGRALTSAAQAGDMVEVLLLPSPEALQSSLAWMPAASGAVAAHRFVTHAAAQAGADANTAGASVAAAADGEAMMVLTCGLAVVEAAAAIAVGGGISSDADGKAAVPGAGPVVARAIEAAAQAGDLILVTLIPN